MALFFLLTRKAHEVFQFFEISEIFLKGTEKEMFVS